MKLPPIQATSATMTINGKEYPVQTLKDGENLSAIVHGPSNFWKWFWFKHWVMRRRRVSISLMVEPDDMERLFDLVKASSEYKHETR